MKRRLRPVVVIAVASALLFGCGDASNPDPAENSQPPETVVAPDPAEAEAYPFPTDPSANPFPSDYPAPGYTTDQSTEPSASPEP